MISYATASGSDDELRTTPGVTLQIVHDGHSRILCPRFMLCPQLKQGSNMAQIAIQCRAVESARAALPERRACSDYFLSMP